MRLKNILIVVKDIEKSKQFYHDLFGLNVLLDNEGNVILTEGLVLQEESIWKKFLDKDIVSPNNSCELYFEERDIETFAEKLSLYMVSVANEGDDTESDAADVEVRDDVIKYICPLTEISPGRKVIRFYDPDGNLIEVGTPWR